jgi:hypothetical protein
MDAPDDAFRWRARAWHLTYAGHVPPEELLALLSAASSVPVLATSIVHEESDAEVPYDHTHFAWLWSRQVNLHGARIMDALMDGKRIHPHMEHRKSLLWLQSIFESYHHGIKACGGRGQHKLVKPVAGPWQQLPAGFEWNVLVITEVSEASDLIDGAAIAGIKVRSMHDVLLLQRGKRPAPFEHNFARNSFRTLALPGAYTTGVVGTLHIWGAVRLGKSEWALAQFENPLYVTERNDLGDFRPDWHDGIVIDKLMPCARPPAGFTLHECERLTDYTLPCSLRCLYKNARIPKGVRKIIVTNERDVWPDDPHGQILGRRVVQMHIVDCTYKSV